MEDYLEYELPTLAHPGSWALAEDSCRFLGWLIRNNRLGRVLEFGSGFSSAVIAGEIRHITGHTLVSIDNLELYSRMAEKRVKDLRWAVAAEFHTFPIRPRIFCGSILPYYAIPQSFFSGLGQFDLVLVDGPHHDLGREASMYAAFPHLKLGGLAIFDDANRPSMERRYLVKWKRYYGSAIEIQHRSKIGNGLAQVRKLSASPAGEPVSCSERLIVSMQSLRNLIRGAIRGTLGGRPLA